MAENKNQHVVVAFFDSEPAAEAAVEALKRWDKAGDEIKLGAIGTITKKDGKIKTHVGRKTGKGATVGAIVGIIAAVLSGGVGLIGGVLAGGVFGGLIGGFFKKSINLTKEDIEQIGAELDAGRVAVVVACDEYEIEPTGLELADAGGTVQNYTVAADVLDEAAEAIEAASLGQDEAWELVGEAYIYAFPMLEDYKTMYTQTIDQSSPAYKGPFNTPSYSTTLAGPENTEIVRYNNDNLYTFIRLDLRAEPMVVTVPAMGDRYYVIQLVEMFTYNLGYIGTRTTGSEPASFMITGPNWDGQQPEQIKQMFRSETNFMLAIQRTAVSPDEVEQVADLIKTFEWQPLHEFMGTSAPAAPPELAFPPYDEKKATSVEFITYLNFLLGQVEIHPHEKPYLERFQRIGVGPDESFEVDQFDPAVLEAGQDGITHATRNIEKKVRSLGKTHNGWQVFSDIFGNRERMQGKYLTRAAAAMFGLYGNDAEEAYYPATLVDENGDDLDGSSHQYVMRFEQDSPPPVNAFWSLTMYSMPEQIMVANPINRYSIGDRTTGLKYGDDGSLTIYIQHESPGADKESNWLPAPNGQFTLQFRAYMPTPEALKTLWAPPPVEKVA
jgi:hypothetical protein